MKERVVLITGATGGIGQALARRFSANGAQVALADRNASCLEALAATVDGATVHVADLRDRDQVAGLVPDVLEAHGHLDVVVANAGWTTHGPFEQLTLDEIDGVLEIDLFGLSHRCSP